MTGLCADLAAKRATVPLVPPECTPVLAALKATRGQPSVQPTVPSPLTRDDVSRLALDLRSIYVVQVLAWRQFPARLGPPAAFGLDFPTWSLG